ncbi:MAG: CHAD domain-containing protein [Chthoniobacterales bacterium]
MSYELRSGEGLGEGIRRICRKQIALAIEASEASRRDDDSPVHRTRKHLKKARAALRLLERATPRCEFKIAWRELRAAAHVISDIRDAEVRFQTIQHLGELLHIEKDEVIERAEAFLDLELESFLAGFSDWKEEVAQRLTTVDTLMKGWPVEKLTCKDARRTAQRTYRRGRETLREARRAPSSDNFHTFRKRAKELMYQVRILRPLHPLIFKELRSDLKVLTEHLGSAHDLAFLEQRLIKRTRKGDDDPAAHALSELLGLREKELQRAAAALSERFYAEKPKAFAKRISGYFSEWEADLGGQVGAVKQIARGMVPLNGR